jgi:hypothetical protein
MSEEITSLPEAVGSIVNKLVENEGASFPFLVAAVGLNGSIRYGRVELIEAERGKEERPIRAGVIRAGREVVGDRRAHDGQHQALLPALAHHAQCLAERRAEAHLNLTPSASWLLQTTLHSREC